MLSGASWEHAQGVHNRGEEWDVEGEWTDQFDSGFERGVCQRLRDHQLRVTTQVPCGRYLIDLVVEDSDGRQLAVECDGDWKDGRPRATKARGLSAARYHRARWLARPPSCRTEVAPQSNKRD